MKEKINSLDNKILKEITLDKSIFGVEVKEDIIHRMVRYQLAKKDLEIIKLKEYLKSPVLQRNLLNKKALVAQDRVVKISSDEEEVIFLDLR